MLEKSINLNYYFNLDVSFTLFYLCSGKMSPALETVVLHVNPRFPPVGQVVLNDKREGRWGEVEENQSMTVIMEDGSAVVPFQQGMSVQILIECKDKHFQVRIQAFFNTHENN